MSGPGYAEGVHGVIERARAFGTGHAAQNIDDVLNLAISRIALHRRTQLFLHQFRFLANAAHHAFVRYRIAIGKRLDADRRSVVIVRKLDASLVSINKESVDGLIRGIAPNPRNHNSVFSLTRKGNRVFAWVEPRAVVYLQVEISDGSRKKRNKVEHMRIALEEMAAPGNLRANTPRLFRLGKHLFGGLALMPNNPTGQPPMWELTPKQKGNYTRLYEYILPKTVKALDPQTYYWPSSPSSGGDFDNPSDETRGDVHYWDVWHGSLPFTDYRNHNFRYVSEFGFQAFPTLKTVESFTEPEDRNIFSYVMEKHQRNNAANSKIMTYLGQTYRYPTTGLGTLLYTSQLLSAEAMKYGVEHWRRHRGQCMGAIVWQLNDCWPVASWSSIDYFGRWKALHYYEKRFFAPVLLSCEEKGFLDDPNPNRECRDLNTDTVKSIRLNVSNETMQPQTVTVKWELRNNRSEVLRDGGEVEITVPAMDTVWLDTVELPEANMFTDHVHYACYQNGEMISESTVLFSVPKYYDYIDPQLSCRVEGDEIIVSAKAYAKSVEVLNENEDWVLEDNYFDLEAGEERRIRIVSGDANGIHMRSVYNIR